MYIQRENWKVMYLISIALFSVFFFFDIFISIKIKKFSKRLFKLHVTESSVIVCIIFFQPFLHLYL